MRLRDLVQHIGEEVSIGNPDSFDRFSNVVDVSLQRGRVLGIVPAITRIVYGGSSFLSYTLEDKKDLLFKDNFYFPSGSYFSALTDLRIAERAKQGRKE